MKSLRCEICNRIFRQVGAIVVSGLLLSGMSAQGSYAQEGNIQEAKVILGELNESGLAGVASLTADGDKTIVNMRVDGALGEHPTHIHQGSCDDFDPNPQYPLTNLQLPPTSMTGTSDTEVDVPLQELLDTPHLILIHKSTQQIGTYFACGDIVAGALTAEQKAAKNITSPFPDTGVGSFADDSIPGKFVRPLMGAAAILFLCALLLGRRSAIFSRF